MTWLLWLQAASAAPEPSIDHVVSDLVVLGGDQAMVPVLPTSRPPQHAWLVAHGDGFGAGGLDRLTVNGRLVGSDGSDGGSEVVVVAVDPVLYDLDAAGPVGWSVTSGVRPALTLLLAWTDGPAREQLRLWLPDADHATDCGAGLLTIDPAAGAAVDDRVYAVGIAGASTGGTVTAGGLTVDLPDATGLAVPPLQRVEGAHDPLAGVWTSEPVEALDWSGLDCGRVDWVLELAPLDRDGDGTADVDDACTEVDDDGDGFFDGGVDRDGCTSATPGDCDDADPAVHPGATDVPGDGLDADCDGDDHCDEDDDTFIAAACGGLDCDDGDADVRPWAVDTPGDGLDSDCDGDDACDEDADGFISFACGGTDCDDEDPLKNPEAFDAPGDGQDKDCDGDDSCDEDGDGRIAPGCGGIDCDDTDPDVGVGETEIWYDGVDQDCDGNDADQDGDGIRAIHAGGRDCDDLDPFISPEAPDFRGDGVDQDCDGADGDASEPGCGGCASEVPPAPLGVVMGLVALVGRRRRRD